MSYKRELQYETLILGEQNILPLPAEQPSQIHWSSTSSLRRPLSLGISHSWRCCWTPSVSPFLGIPFWARVLIASFSCFYLIFRSLILFSLSLFLRIRMNWLKKCSWSFFFCTRRKRWSRPYFSANSLKVVLWKRRPWEAGDVPGHPQDLDPHQNQGIWER